MAVSRYRNLSILNQKHYETPNPISKKDLDNIQTFSIRTTAEDRLDTLAARYLGDDTYWWIIAELNDIQWAFDFVPGKILKIPVNVEDVLKLV